MPANEVLARLAALAQATLFPFVRVDDDGHIFFNFSDPEAKKHMYLIRRIKSRKREAESEKSSTRALTKRVELPGRHAGIEGLSAHDSRHYWATYEARNGTPLEVSGYAGPLYKSV